MPVAIADLKFYQAANMPEDDVSVVGGAINTAGEVEFTPLAANDSIEALSDNAADTMNLTVTGRDASGAIVSETVALNGTTVVPFTTLGVIERILKIVLGASAAGNVTVRRAAAGPTIKVLAPGITSTRREFYDSASDVSATTRYEKFFAKNTNGTSTLNNAAIKLTADPSAVIMIGVAPAINDVATSTNRLTAPAGVTFVDDNVSQAVPGAALAAGDAIGIWAEMALNAGAAALKSSFTTELSGTTA